MHSLLLSYSDSSRATFAEAFNSAITRAVDTSVPQGEEDSDDWLHLDATDFDAMLEKTIGRSSANKSGQEILQDAMDVDAKTNDGEDPVVKTQATRLQELASKVEEFIEGKGDLEGAQFAE